VSLWDAVSATPRLVRDALWHGVAPAGVTTLSVARREGLSELHWKAVGDALARFLSGGGPALTKLGQILATREDLLPPAVCQRLARLYADQAPMSRREVRRVLKRAYPADAPFADFEATPLGVGSVGQVHRARLRDGSPVVVKLLRPGVEQALQQDMRAARAFVDLFFRLGGEDARDRREGVLRMLDDLARAFGREVDLELEARELEAFGRRLAGSARVRVPHCYRELSSALALVQEELRGVPLSALRDEAGTRRDDARRAAHLALTEILSQVFGDGHFHADPHAGNLLLLEDGRLGLIDLGLTARLGPSERRTIARAVRALLARDIDTTFRLLLELGTPPPDFELAPYRAAIAGVLGQHGRIALSRVSGARSATGRAGPVDGNGLERMVDELFAVTRRHGILLPESTTLLIKTLVTIEGVARALDPEINVVVKAVPIVLRSLAPAWPGLPSWLRRDRG
jgi:ubiquinone biosynthesis protein